MKVRVSVLVQKKSVICTRRAEKPGSSHTPHFSWSWMTQKGKRITMAFPCPGEGHDREEWDLDTWNADVWMVVHEDWNSQILPNLRACRIALLLPSNTPRGLSHENQQVPPQDLPTSSLLTSRPITMVCCSITSQEYAVPGERRKRLCPEEAARPIDTDQQELGEQVWDTGLGWCLSKEARA